MVTGLITYQPIGVIRSPWNRPKDSPIQPSGARDTPGRAEINPDLADGLRDLDGFSHLILLYHLHLAGSAKLTVRPFLDDAEHGVFATRAPVRPNPLGLSVVRLERLEGDVLHLLDVDILDGTPLLDLKPYVPEFDQPQGPVRTGWLSQNGREVETKRADERFKD